MQPRKIKKVSLPRKIKKVPLIGVAGQRATIGIRGSRYSIKRQPDIITIGKLPTRPKVVRK